MNKKILMGLGISLLLAPVFVSSTFAQGEKEQTHTAWFDMDHCAICKNMAENKDMMAKIKWETYMIPDGFLSIAVVPDDMKDAMAKAEKGMEKAIAKLEAGEQLELCGYCSSFGSLLAEGAKKTDLKTVGGDIMMLTSTDPEVVKKIQEHAKKSMAEHKKMMEEMKKTQTKADKKPSK